MQYEKALGDDQNLKLVESVVKNAYHYIEIFSRAVDAALPEPSKDPK